MKMELPSVHEGEVDQAKAARLLEAIAKGQRDFAEGRFVEFDTEEEFTAFLETL